MCMSCGCLKPFDDHGKSKNITYDDLVAAAKAGGVKDPAEVLSNIDKTFGGMKRDPGNGSTVREVTPGYYGGY